MERFCNNNYCPNSKLEMNNEKHYHNTDGAIGGIYGVVKTHYVELKKIKEKYHPRQGIFKPKRLEKIVEIKKCHFCDTCYQMIKIIKEYEL